jgi:hypothetical protein
MPPVPGTPPGIGFRPVKRRPGCRLALNVKSMFRLGYAIVGYVTGAREEMSGMAPTRTWTRLSRRLAFDHNPLRRREDVIAAWLLPGVIVALLILGPLMIFGADRWAAARNEAAWQAQQTWHWVPAVLLTSAPGPLFPDGGANSWITWTPARWTADGATRTASVPVVSDTRSGTTVTVWLDRNGNVREPLTQSAARNRVMTAAALSLLALTLLLTAAALIIRSMLNRRRLAGWETGWLSAEQQWSSSGS